MQHASPLGNQEFVWSLCDDLSSRKNRLQDLPLALNVLASTFFAINQGNNTQHLETFLLSAIDSFQGRIAGRRNIFNNHNPGAWRQVLASFQPLAGAVPFGLFTNYEGMDRLAIESRGDRRCRCDRIGTHGQAPDAVNRSFKGFNNLPESFTDQQTAFAMKSRLFTIKIKIALAPGSQSHFTLLVRQFTYNLHQFTTFLFCHHSLS